MLLGGNQVGRVTAVRPLLSGDGAVSHWLVRIKIGSDYKLYSNAVINLERPLIGSLSTINIRDPGRKGLASDGGAAESSMLAENSIIEGKPSRASSPRPDSRAKTSRTSPKCSRTSPT